MRFLQLFFLLASINCFSQSDSIVEYSRLEKMIMQPGSFVRIDTDTLGIAGNLAIGVITSVDLNSNKKQRSVCFIPGNTFSTIAFSFTNLQIDIEDLGDFISALMKMKEAVDSKNANGLQSFHYTTSSLTVLRTENRTGNQSKWDISIYKRYKYINAPVPGTVFFLRGKDIGELIDLLSNYRNSLKDNLYE